MAEYRVSEAFTTPDSVRGSSTGSPIDEDTVFLLKLSDNLESLLSPSPLRDHVFSDAIISVQGRAVPVHRCILASRCPFFRDLFRQDDALLKALSPNPAKQASPSSKLKIDLHRLITHVFAGARVGFEAFMVALGFLYTGKIKLPFVSCIDDICTHEACFPAVDFAVELLTVSSAFNITELMTISEHHLIKMVHKAEIDDALHILGAAHMLKAVLLQVVSVQVVAKSNLGIIDLERHLPLNIKKEIYSLRVELGLVEEVVDPIHEQQRRRIWKALDSDDVELVQLLLKEGRITLNDAYALHYAAAYCDSHTLQDILELGLADPNLKDGRGHTVLHVSVRRRDPTFLVTLLTKGANPMDVTLDGKSALQLCRRLVRNIVYHNNMEASEELHKDKLCIEILEQARKSNPFYEAQHLPAANGNDLFMKLLYLENRVALARLLFPREAKLVMGIARLETTSEFTGIRNEQKTSMDLNQTPNQYGVNELSVLDPCMHKSLSQRLQALQKTSDIGSRLFPRCTGILNTFMDDELLDLTCLEKGSPDEQKIKRQRYDELKSTLAAAFQKDVAAMDKPNLELSCNPSSSNEDAKIV